MRSSQSGWIVWKARTVSTVAVIDRSLRHLKDAWRKRRRPASTKKGAPAAIDARAIQTCYTYAHVHSHPRRSPSPAPPIITRDFLIEAWAWEPPSQEEQATPKAAALSGSSAAGLIAMDMTLAQLREYGELLLLDRRAKSARRRRRHQRRRRRSALASASALAPASLRSAHARPPARPAQKQTAPTPTNPCFWLWTASFTTSANRATFTGQVRGFFRRGARRCRRACCALAVLLLLLRRWTCAPNQPHSPPPL